MKLGGKSHYTAIDLPRISTMLRGYDIQPSSLTLQINPLHLLTLPPSSLTCTSLSPSVPFIKISLHLKLTACIFNPHFPTLIMLHLSLALEVSQSLALTTACHLLWDLVSPLDHHNQSHHLHTFWGRRGTLLRQAPLGTSEGWGGGIWYQTTSSADHIHILKCPTPSDHTYMYIHHLEHTRPH